MTNEKYWLLAYQRSASKALDQSFRKLIGHQMLDKPLLLAETPPIAYPEPSVP